jgi:hypothetical protein
MVSKYTFMLPTISERRVAGAIPDGVIGLFYSLTSFGRTVALGPTQPLIEMCSRGVSWCDKGGRSVGLTTLPPSWAECLEVLGASTS